MHLVRKKWFLALVVTLLTGGVWLWLASAPAQFSFVLADGTRIRFSKATFGTNHVFVPGNPFKKLLYSSFPAQGISLGRFRWMPDRYERPTPKEQLLLWFENDGKATPPAVLVSTNPAKLPTQMLFLSGEINNERGNKTTTWPYLVPVPPSRPAQKNNQVFVLPLTIFPRSGKQLAINLTRFHVDDFNSLLQSNSFVAVDSGLIRIKSPVSKSRQHAEWKPESTPILQKQQQAGVELVSLQVPPQENTSAESFKIPFFQFGNANLRIHLVPHFNQSEWKINEIILSDPHGNELTPSRHHASPIGSAEIGFYMSDFLDPRDPWEVKVQLAQVGKYDPSDILEFKIPNPSSYTGKLLMQTNILKGKPYLLTLAPGKVTLRYAEEGQKPTVSFANMHAFSQSPKGMGHGSVEFAVAITGPGGATTLIRTSTVSVSHEKPEIVLQCPVPKIIPFSFKVRPEVVPDFYEKYPKAKKKSGFPP